MTSDCRVQCPRGQNLGHTSRGYTCLSGHFLSHLLIARCDIGVQLSVRSSVRSFVRSSVRPSVHNLCQGAYSVAVIAGSMKPCIVITLDTHFKKAP